MKEGKILENALESHDNFLGFRLCNEKEDLLLDFFMMKNKARQLYQFLSITRRLLTVSSL
jgi:hypothetical protein